MPIHPLEKKKRGDDYSFIPKIIFLILLIIAGFMIDKFAPWKHQSFQANSNVLGAENNSQPTHSIQQDVQNLTENLGQTAGKITDTAVGGAVQLIGNVASESSQAVSSLIFDNTVGSVVKQIDTLPLQEQQKLKDQICK